MNQNALGRYRLLDRLGAGGMGDVWKAHDSKLDRIVAIKMLRGGLGSPGNDAGRERFRREALTLSRLSHDGIAMVFDFDSEGDQDFLVMEFVPGGTLESRLQEAPLPLALSAFERHEEALLAAQTSVRLDPLAVMLHTILADVYYFARQYEKAVVSYRMAIELDPRFASAHTDLARALEALGRLDDARAAYETGRRLAGGIAGPSFGLAHLEAAAGNVAEARRMLGELTATRAQRVVSAWGIGAVHASLGDIDEAYRWFEIAVQEKASGLILLCVGSAEAPTGADSGGYVNSRAAGKRRPL